MLLGKLATPATKVYQHGAFSTTTATAEYMIVKTDTFLMGGKSVIFELRFGNLVVENEKERFDGLLVDKLTMTTEELTTWGTDDSVLFDLIANKLNIVLTEKIIKDLSSTY